MQIAKIDENWYKLQKLEVSISANLSQFYPICTNFTQFSIRFFEKKSRPLPLQEEMQFSAVFRNLPNFIQLF